MTQLDVQAKERIEFSSLMLLYFMNRMIKLNDSQSLHCSIIVAFDTCTNASAMSARVHAFRISACHDEGSNQLTVDF